MANTNMAGSGRLTDVGVYDFTADKLSLVRFSGLKYWLAPYQSG